MPFDPDALPALAALAFATFVLFHVLTGRRSRALDLDAPSRVAIATVGPVTMAVRNIRREV